MRGFAAVEKHGPGLVRIHACRSCNADVLWARTMKGAWMLVDAHPKAEGRFQIVASPERVECVAYADPSQRAYRFEAHHATCKQAKVTA